MLGGVTVVFAVRLAWLASTDVTNAAAAVTTGKDEEQERAG